MSKGIKLTRSIISLKTDPMSKLGSKPTNRKGPSFLILNSFKSSHSLGKFSASSNSGIDLYFPSK